MKITKIERDPQGFRIFNVTFEPRWYERIFGIKTKIKKYRDTDRTYTYGSGTVYVNEKGKQLGNGHWIGEKIDCWRNGSQNW